MDYSAFHWAEKARKYAETIGTVFNVKGRVDTIQNLPASGNKVGDLWLVGLVTDPDLSEYAWLSFDNVTRWEKIGSTGTTASFSTLTGSPYDNTSLGQALNAKQDAIDDLATIRSGAASGATALQPANITKNDYAVVSYGTNGLVSGGFKVATNCIVEIPQDFTCVVGDFDGTAIWADGSATFPTGKSGSTATFEKRNIPSEALHSSGSDNELSFLVCSSTTLYAAKVSDSISGTTPPTNGLFYNTNTNIISLYQNGSQVATNLSLPLCTFTKTSGIPQQIEMELNGFSYIGTKVFVLAGVKGLVPRGRSSTGDLITLEKTNTNTRVSSETLSDGNYKLLLGTNWNVIQDVYYNEYKNYNMTSSLSIKRNDFIAGDLTVSGGKITNIRFKVVFHPVDYYDLQEKQDTLESGTNIKTINGNSILGSGDISIGGSVAIDNSSITTNSSSQLQTVGVIDNRSGNAIKTWTGTKAQYDAITTKDSNTLYNITDDTDVGLTVLQAIYPVGSIYIGTMSTCPLASLFGTWTLVSAGRVLQGADSNHSAGSTIEAGIPDITGTLDNVRIGSGLDTKNGVFSDSENIGDTAGGGSSAYWARLRINFKASNSSSIYGNSNTVQPPAFVVNIWQRTA